METTQVLRAENAPLPGTGHAVSRSPYLCTQLMLSR